MQIIELRQMTRLTEQFTHKVVVKKSRSANGDPGSAHSRGHGQGRRHRRERSKPLNPPSRPCKHRRAAILQHLRSRGSVAHHLRRYSGGPPVPGGTDAELAGPQPPTGNKPRGAKEAKVRSTGEGG